MNNILIGISGKKLSGKDALCSAIQNAYRFSAKTKRIAFADELKQEVALACGVSSSFIEDNKQQFRPILQWWGTDFRRHFQGDDYWVNKTLNKINASFDSGFNVIIIPDVRFQSEATTLKMLGAILIRVARPTQLIDTHVSETDLDSYKGFDHIVLNNGSLQDLDSETKAILTKHNIKTK